MKEGSEKKQGGFALVVTIVLTTVILAVITLASKEMSDESKNSTRLDNSLIAYYSAEAGIENALLSYRYNRSAEIPEGCKKTIDESVVNCNDVKNYKTHYYKLKMSSKTNTSSSQKVYKDETYEIPINDGSIATVNINWVNKDLAPDTSIRVEVSAYSETGAIIDKKLSDPRGDGEADNILIDLKNTTFTGKKIIRVKPLYTTPSGKSGEIQMNNEPKPYIELDVPQGTGTTKTTIESTGYYGGVARKITMNIDGTSGNILNIFDYVIYSDSDLLKVK